MFVRRSARAGVLPALVLSLALAGCGGDDEIEPKMPDSNSAASTNTAESPSPTEPVEPTLPPEAEGDDAAAAEAFVRHYFDYVNYAQATGDTKGLRELALPGCPACNGVADGIDRVYKRGGEMRGGELTITKGKTYRYPTDAGQPQTFSITISYTNTAQKIVRAGNLNATYARGSAAAKFLVVRDRRGWSIAKWEPV